MFHTVYSNIYNINNSQTTKVIDTRSYLTTGIYFHTTALPDHALKIMKCFKKSFCSPQSNKIIVGKYKAIDWRNTTSTSLIIFRI